MISPARIAKTYAETPPRSAKRIIASATGLNFCDRNCGCGENNRLWWFPSGTLAGDDGIPEWVPGWMNGADTSDIWRWLVENGKVIS